MAPAIDHSTGIPSLSAASIHGSRPLSGQVMSGIGPIDSTATWRSTVWPWCSATTFTVEPVSGSYTHSRRLKKPAMSSGSHRPPATPACIGAGTPIDRDRCIRNAMSRGPIGRASNPAPFMTLETCRTSSITRTVSGSGCCTPAINSSWTARFGLGPIHTDRVTILVSRPVCCSRRWP